MNMEKQLRKALKEALSERDTQRGFVTELNGKFASFQKRLDDSAAETKKALAHNDELQKTLDATYDILEAAQQTVNEANTKIGELEEKVAASSQKELKNLRKRLQTKTEELATEKTLRQHEHNHFNEWMRTLKTPGLTDWLASRLAKAQEKEAALFANDEEAKMTPMDKASEMVGLFADLPGDVINDMWRTMRLSMAAKITEAELLSKVGEEGEPEDTEPTPDEVEEAKAANQAKIDETATAHTNKLADEFAHNDQAVVVKAMAEAKKEEAPDAG